jgi:hypothetical protein
VSAFPFIGRYRSCWPRLYLIREGSSLVHSERGTLIGVQIVWRRNRETDEAF